MSDVECRSFKNGIWLCDICARLVDDNKSAYQADELRKWKADAEVYVAELVTQDTRLRQLRGYVQHLLSAVRMLTAIVGPGAKLDASFWNANQRSLARDFIESEQMLFENGFVSEADVILQIGDELNRGIIQTHILGLREKDFLNLSKWKDESVRRLMIDVMRFSKESYVRYLEVETALASNHLKEVRTNYPNSSINTIADLNYALPRLSRGQRASAI